MEWGGAVLSWVLVATAGTQLSDYLETKVHGIQLILYDVLRHAPAMILHQKSRTAVIWEIEGVKAHTFFPIEGQQCSDRSSEFVGGRWKNHQALGSKLGHKTDRAECPQTEQEGTGVTRT